MFLFNPCIRMKVKQKAINNNFLAFKCMISIFIARKFKRAESVTQRSMGYGKKNHHCRRKLFLNGVDLRYKQIISYLAPNIKSFQTQTRIYFFSFWTNFNEDFLVLFFTLSNQKWHEDTEVLCFYFSIKKYRDYKKKCNCTIDII